jgi:hypothetical protein
MDFFMCTNFTAATRSAPDMVSSTLPPRRSFVAAAAISACANFRAAASVDAVASEPAYARIAARTFMATSELGVKSSCPADDPHIFRVGGAEPDELRDLSSFVDGRTTCVGGTREYVVDSGLGKRNLVYFLCVAARASSFPASGPWPPATDRALGCFRQARVSTMAPISRQATTVIEKASQTTFSITTTAFCLLKEKRKERYSSGKPPPAVQDPAEVRGAEGHYGHWRENHLKL